MKNKYIFDKALWLFSEKLRSVLASVPINFSGNIFEIRLHTHSPIYFSTDSGIKFLSSNGRLCDKPDCFSYVCSAKELQDIVNKAAAFSVFAHERELKSGYITYQSGIRIGVCSANSVNGFSLNSVNALNIRLPFNSMVQGSERLLHLLDNLQNGLLVAGPPSSGKTTMLKFCCHTLSSGKLGRFYKVCVVDERNELSVNCFSDTYGVCADIISGYSKKDSIERALRLFAPDIILCDEIGSEDEVGEILSGLNSGVKFIASIHASDLTQICRRPQFRRLFNENVFDNVLFLSSDFPGVISDICSYEVIRDAIHKYNNDLYKLHSYGNAYFPSSKKKSVYT